MQISLSPEVVEQQEIIGKVKAIIKEHKDSPHINVRWFVWIQDLLIEATQFGALERLTEHNEKFENSFRGLKVGSS